MQSLTGTIVRPNNGDIVRPIVPDRIKWGYEYLKAHAVVLGIWTTGSKAFVVLLYRGSLYTLFPMEEDKAAEWIREHAL